MDLPLQATVLNGNSDAACKEKVLMWEKLGSQSVEGFVQTSSANNRKDVWYTILW
jgi:hypothetical protein